MQKFINIPYLEKSHDLNEDGSLKSHVTNGKPAVVLVFGNFCGFCTRIKPDFQDAANTMRNNGVQFCVAQLDLKEEPDTIHAANHIMNVSQNRGVPLVIGYKSSGEPVKYNGDRTKTSFLNFAKSLI